MCRLFLARTAVRLACLRVSSSGKLLDDQMVYRCGGGSVDHRRVLLP